MSDNDVKIEDEHKDMHEDGGDDEVRAGTFGRFCAMDTTLELCARPHSDWENPFSMVLTIDFIGRDISHEEKSGRDGS